MSALLSRLPGFGLIHGASFVDTYLVHARKAILGLLSEKILNGLESHGRLVYVGSFEQYPDLFLLSPFVNNTHCLWNHYESRLYVNVSGAFEADFAADVVAHLAVCTTQNLEKLQWLNAAVIEWREEQRSLDNPDPVALMLADRCNWHTVKVQNTKSTTHYTPLAVHMLIKGLLLDGQTNSNLIEDTQEIAQVERLLRSKSKSWKVSLHTLLAWGFYNIRKAADNASFRSVFLITVSEDIWHPLSHVVEISQRKLPEKEAFFGASCTGFKLSKAPLFSKELSEDSQQRLLEAIKSTLGLDIPTDSLSDLRHYSFGKPHTDVRPEDWSLSAEDFTPIWPPAPDRLSNIKIRPFARLIPRLIPLVKNNEKESSVTYNLLYPFSADITANESTAHLPYPYVVTADCRRPVSIEGCYVGEDLSWAELDLQTPYSPKTVRALFSTWALQGPNLQTGRPYHADLCFWAVCAEKIDASAKKTVGLRDRKTKDFFDTTLCGTLVRSSNVPALPPFPDLVLMTLSVQDELIQAVIPLAELKKILPLGKNATIELKGKLLACNFTDTRSWSPLMPDEFADLPDSLETRRQLRRLFKDEGNLNALFELARREEASDTNNRDFSLKTISFLIRKDYPAAYSLSAIELISRYCTPSDFIASSGQILNVMPPRELGILRELLIRGARLGDLFCMRICSLQRPASLSLANEVLDMITQKLAFEHSEGEAIAMLLKRYQNSQAAFGEDSADKALFVNILTHAVSSGFDAGAYNLARFIATGIGCPPNPKLAMRILQHAASHGDTQSIYWEMLFECFGVRIFTEDHAKLIEELLPSAEEGESSSQVIIGLHYFFEQKDNPVHLEVAHELLSWVYETTADKLSKEMLDEIDRTIDPSNRSEEFISVWEFLGIRQPPRTVACLSMFHEYADTLSFHDYYLQQLDELKSSKPSARLMAQISFFADNASEFKFGIAKKELLPPKSSDILMKLKFEETRLTAYSGDIDSCDQPASQLLISSHYHQDTDSQDVKSICPFFYEGTRLSASIQGGWRTKSNDAGVMSVGFGQEDTLTIFDPLWAITYPYYIATVKYDFIIYGLVGSVSPLMISDNTPLPEALAGEFDPAALISQIESQLNQDHFYLLKTVCVEKARYTVNSTIISISPTVHTVGGINYHKVLVAAPQILESQTDSLVLYVPQSVLKERNLQTDHRYEFSVELQGWCAQRTTMDVTARH